MKRLFILSVMSLFIISAQAQFFKKLKTKINESSRDVKGKIKEKAATAPDRIIDHAATKVETKAETKIDNKETNANSKVDKTVDKVDSIKIKKPTPKEPVDSVPGTAQIHLIKGLTGVKSCRQIYFSSYYQIIFLYESKIYL